MPQDDNDQIGSKDFHLKDTPVEAQGDGVRLIGRDNVIIESSHIKSGGVGIFTGPEDSLIPGESRSMLNRAASWLMDNIVAATVAGVIAGGILWYAGLVG
ncbi:hypothetical protein HFN97_26010 [Rhizobium laguerreae]|uniref:hypothetical protein n=1 Tax=Rhizobium laguerreae TaxID=1076926 RepID=UPI001C90154D|nr:hypothetical protein [Rhizobium laguerreae]MBY3361230.1 hypothetical protein [Rhizobium laguerreae]